MAAKFPRLLEQYRRPGASVSWEDARERLFKQILDEVETITDPVHRTALLLVAARQAAELGDVARVNMVLNILDDPHVTAVDVLALKLFSFHGVELQKLDPSRRADLARNLLADIWIAYRHDDYELAQQVLKVAESSINGITGHRFIQHDIGQIRNQLGAEKKRSAEHRAAWESARTLLDDSGEPQSAEGHFQLAMYLLNVKGDWQQSLAHLTECGDSQLADAAARDIAGSFNPAEMLATAKAWIDAERMPAHLRNGRAAFWLRTARSHNLIGQIGKDVDTAWDVLGERLSDRDRGAEDGWIWLEESGWQELDSAGRPTRPLAIAPFDEKTAGQHRVAWAQHLGVRPTETNSIGMRFVFIPPGEFLMGSPTSDNDAKSDELPQHPVRITKPFYLGLYEVTQGEYQQIMGDNPSHFKGDSRSPVERVSWEDAMEFCRRLSALSQEQAAGRIYRLPTEAEWEYACRAGTTTIYSFGDSAESLGDYAWYSGNSIRKTHPAGQKQPNAWGLYDMHGNVWEWCTDRWDAADYAHSALNDSIGPDGGSARVYRGGAWSSDARGCWSAYRGGALPSYRGDDLGFRLARCSVK